MPYPTVVPSADANADRVNQFRTYASQLGDPAQAQIDADTKAYNDHVAQLGDVASPPSSSTSSGAAGATAPDSTSGVDWVRARVKPEYQQYVDQAVAAAQKYGVDPNIYARQIFQESGFDPNAGSNEGAHGIAQFTTPTAQGYGIDPWNPGQSLDAGARYMASNLKANNGDYRLALAAYNAGQGNVNKYGQQIFNAAYLKSQGWSDQDANQPSQYIAAILGSTSPTSTGQSDQSGAGQAAAGVVSNAPTASNVSGLDATPNPTGVRTSFGSGESSVLPQAQPPSPNDDLKAFSAYASSLGDPGGTSSFGQNPEDSTSPIDQARSQQPSSSTPDFGSMASSALSSVGGMVSSMLPKAQDQGFSLQPGPAQAPESINQPLGQPRSFTMAPYDDMAGATSQPAPASGFTMLTDLPKVPPSTAQPGLIDQALGIVSKASTIPQQVVSAAVMPDLGHINETPQQRTQRYWNEHTDPKADPITRLGQLLDYATSIEDTQVANVVRQDPNAGFIAPAFKAATNPLSYLGVSKPMMIAGGVGAAGFGGAKALQGGTPGEVGTAAVEGFGTGQLVGGLGEGAYALGKVAAPTVGRGLVALGDAGKRAGIVPGLTIEDASKFRPGEPGALSDAYFVEDGKVESFPKAGPVVDGLTVRKDIPNTDSIEATYGSDYEVLPGIREFSIGESRPATTERVRDLANQIAASREINPLIVAIDDQGLSILEGAHRYDALSALGVKSAPALVVVDRGAVPASPLTAALRSVGDQARRLASEESGAVGFPGRTRPPQVPPPPPPPPAGSADKLIEMYTETPKKVPQSPGEITAKAGQAFVNAWTDRGVAWNRWQQQVEKTIGRPLNADEMSAELNRLNPDMAARVMVQEGLQPAIQAVPKEDLSTLSAYLTAQHNVDVARSMGQKVQTEALKVPLATTEGEKRVRTLNAQIRSYERLKSDAAAAGDGTGVTHYDGLLVKSKADLATANRLAMKQVTALDAARAAGAQVAGKTAEDVRQFSGGLNANESQQALIELQLRSTPQQWQAIQTASDKIDAYVGTLRQRMVDAGLWTPELAQELKTQYPHYNPTKILDYMSTPDSIPGGTSISVRDQGLKKFTVEGTDRLREDPLASLQRLAYQTESLAKRNEAFNAFVKTNQLIHGPNHPLRVIRKVADDYTPINTESKIAGFVDGKKQTYVMPKEFADAIAQAPMSPIKGLPVIAAVYRALLTSKNIAFAAGQIPLDAYSYAIREATRAGGPQHLPQIMTELVKAYGDTFKGLVSQTYHGGTAEFLKGGGGFAGHFQINPGQTRQSIEALHRASAFEITSGADLRRIVKDALTFAPVEAVGARAELAPRVASMKLAQKAGANKVQTIINGRTVTMDFDQGGTWSKYINQFVPFFNVGLQGLATPARTIRDNPRGALATFAGLLMAPTIGAEVWNNSDPQRAKDYADIPNYIKDRSIVLMIPGAVAVDSQGERHPQYVEIRSREFSPFVDATRAAMQRVLGTDTRKWQDMAGGALNAASPVNTDSGLLGVAGSVSPPILSQAYDLGANKSSYTGATIATKSADQRASTLSKGITSGVNAASDAMGAGLNVRPSQTEFLSRDVLGGPGQMARDVSNMASGQGGSGLPQDTPLIGQVTKRFVGGSVGQRLQTAQDQRISDATRPILRDAGIYDITPVSDHINNGKENIPLSNDEQAYYQELVNVSIDSYLPRIAAHPDFQKLSPADKAAQLQYWMDKIRKASAAATLKIVDPGPARERMRLEQAAKAG